MLLLAVVCTSQLVWDRIPSSLTEVAGASLTELRQTCQKFSIQSLPKVLFLSSAPFARELRDQALWPPSTEYIFAVRTFGVPRPAANLQIVQCFLHPYGLEDYAVACSCFYMRLCEFEFIISWCWTWKEHHWQMWLKLVRTRLTTAIQEDPPPQVCHLVPFKCLTAQKSLFIVWASMVVRTTLLAFLLPTLTFVFKDRSREFNAEWAFEDLLLDEIELFLRGTL